MEVVRVLVAVAGGFAVAWSLLAAPRTGVINVFARTLGATAPVLNIYTLGGLIFVMSLYLSPYVFLTVKAVMSRMDASLEARKASAGWRPSARPA